MNPTSTKKRPTLKAALVCSRIVPEADGTLTLSHVLTKLTLPRFSSAEHPLALTLELYVELAGEFHAHEPMFVTIRTPEGTETRTELRLRAEQQTRLRTMADEGSGIEGSVFTAELSVQAVCGRFTVEVFLGDQHLGDCHFKLLAPEQSGPKLSAEYKIQEFRFRLPLLGLLTDRQPFNPGDDEGRFTGTLRLGRYAVLFTDLTLRDAYEGHFHAKYPEDRKRIVQAVFNDLAELRKVLEFLRDGKEIDGVVFDPKSTSPPGQKASGEMTGEGFTLDEIFAWLDNPQKTGD